MRTIQGSRLSILVLAAMTACHETYIDLTPDGGSDGAGDGTVVVPPPPCGNGVTDPGEECDDGNRLNGDGCTWDCRIGSGDPVGPPDPEAVACRAEPARRLDTVDAPPVAGSPALLAVIGLREVLAAVWNRHPLSAEEQSAISGRFLAADGTPLREDVVFRLGTGRTAWFLSAAGAEDALLLAWRMDDGGIWKARLTPADGMADPPFPLIEAPNADMPALAAGLDRYYLAWYEGDDTRHCFHDGSGPSAVKIRRLSADGSTDGMPPPVTLESESGAWTTPDVAVGSDGSVGLLWWRASTEAGGSCTLRFGAGDEALTAVRDGGTIGPGTGGRVIEAEGTFRAVWYQAQDAGDLHLGIAAFDHDGVLLGAPVTTSLPGSSLTGDIEVAAGDGGLTLVASLYETSSGLRLRFARTDRFGRMVGGFEDVDPTCTPAAGCVPGAFNVARVPGGFVVLYFAEIDSGGPERLVELRMVRLVPVS